MLTTNEQDYLEKSFVYFLKDSDQTHLFNLINRSILIKKPVITKEQFINIWQAKLNSITKNLYGYKSNISNTAHKNLDGSINPTTKTLTISKEAIKSLYDNGMDDLKALDTFFHEMIHLKQQERGRKAHINNLDALLNKETLLCTYIPNFYTDNYLDLSFEKEALMLEGLHTIDYLYTLSGKTDKSDLQTKATEIQRYLEQNNTIRIFNDEPSDINKEFEKFITDKPFLLNQFNSRYLDIEFIEENGKVRAKTSDELINSMPQDLPPQSEDYYMTIIGRRIDLEATAKQSNNVKISSSSK